MEPSPLHPRLQGLAQSNRSRLTSILRSTQPETCSKTGQTKLRELSTMVSGCTVVLVVFLSPVVNTPQGTGVSV